MVRRKVGLSRIENQSARQITFAKRRQGLVKKARELSVLCDAQIALIIFSSTGKLSQYCTEPSSMEDIIRRYQNEKGTRNPENNHHDQLETLRMMQKETLNLQRFSGEDLSSIKSEDLDELEKQLECSVNKVRARKIEFLQQEMDNLEMKEKLLHEENDQLYYLMKENEAALMEHHQQVAMVPNTSEEQRRVLDQFPFSGEEQPSSVLQLAALPSVFNPYIPSPSCSAQPSGFQSPAPQLWWFNTP